MFGVRGSDFQAFSCSSSGTQWHTCFFSESGKSCNHGFNSWDLEEGKKQTSVLAKLRNERQLLLPRCPTPAGEVAKSPLPSLVQTSGRGCSDLIYYLLICIQPRRCSPGQLRREVSQSWSARPAVCVSLPCYAPPGQECIRPVRALPIKTSSSAASRVPAGLGRGHTDTSQCPARPQWLRVRLGGLCDSSSGSCPTWSWSFPAVLSALKITGEAPLGAAPQPRDVSPPLLVPSQSGFVSGHPTLASCSAPGSFPDGQGSARLCSGRSCRSGKL